MGRKPPWTTSSVSKSVDIILDGLITTPTAPRKADTILKPTLILEWSRVAWRPAAGMNVKDRVLVQSRQFRMKAKPCLSGLVSGVTFWLVGFQLNGGASLNPLHQAPKGFWHGLLKGFEETVKLAVLTCRRWHGGVWEVETAASWQLSRQEEELEAEGRAALPPLGKLGRGFDGDSCSCSAVSLLLRTLDFKHSRH